MAGEWIPGKARELAPGFFPGEWTDLGGDVLQGHCPGREAHGHQSAATDCRIYLAYGPQGQTPGAYCQHNSCKGVLDRMNDDFRTALFRRDGEERGAGEAGVVISPPRAREGWVPEFSISRLRGLVAGVPEVTPEWLARRSAVDVAKVDGPGDFLERVFAPGERAMVFTEFKGPGDYLWEVGNGGYRLSPQMGVRAVRSKLPRDGGREGVWFLANPVDGQWHANPRRPGTTSRRATESVTRWKHLILECDEEKSMKKQAAILLAARAEADPKTYLEKLKVPAPLVERWMPERERWEAMAAQLKRDAREVPGLWLRLLAMCGLPIVAIYTSGGASVHALVREDRESHAEFSEIVRQYKHRLPLVGADPAALTPVRLTRLPGCTRGGRPQRLLYLNPAAPEKPILSL